MRKDATGNSGTNNCSTFLPVGTRIRFVKSLYGAATGDSPACVYAEKGDGGVVTGHGTPEGHWVKWDKWPHAFGSEYGTEFVEAQQQYFIVDIRHDWRKQKYITFWRPNNSNYAWPLSWAGRYDKSVVDSEPSYYCNTNGGKSLVRFPVACEIVEAMVLTAPDSGDIDGNAGPVLRNSEKVRRKLRASAYIPEGAVTTAVNA